MNNLHHRMDQANRAKQFMPFDALKGFREALAEKEKLLVPKKELSEERKAELEEYEKYVQTKKYVEEVAREKLGLVYENEIIFKPEK